MESIAQIHRELADLIQSLDSTFSGQVILPEEPLQQREDEEEETEIIVLQFAIKPNDGLYKDCRVCFEMTFWDGYPDGSTPEVKCLDTIAHPNIAMHNYNGNVCVSLLGDWSVAECHRDISCVVQAVLFLFYNPEVDDPLVPVGNLEELQSLVEATKRGTKPSDKCSRFSQLIFSNIYEGEETDAVEMNEMEENERTTQDNQKQQISVEGDGNTTFADESDINVVDSEVTTSFAAENVEAATAVVLEERETTTEQVAEETIPATVSVKTAAAADTTSDTIEIETASDVTEKTITDSVKKEFVIHMTDREETTTMTRAAVRELLTSGACSKELTPDVITAEDKEHFASGDIIKPEQLNAAVAVVADADDCVVVTEDRIVAVPSPPVDSRVMCC